MTVELGTLPRCPECQRAGHKSRVEPTGRIQLAAGEISIGTRTRQVTVHGFHKQVQLFACTRGHRFQVTRTATLGPGASL